MADMEDAEYVDPEASDDHTYDNMRPKLSQGGTRSGDKTPFTKRKITVATYYTASIWIWAAFGTLVFSCFFHVIAFSTPGWVQVKSAHGPTISIITRDVGLWQECRNDIGCAYLGINDFSRK